MQNISQISNRKRSVCIKASLSLLLLFLGGVIYLIFRSKHLPMFDWVKVIHLDGYVNQLRDGFSGIDLPTFVKYCLPNGLWMASYTLIIDAFIDEENNKNFWIFILPGISVFLEILQFFHITAGTFDLGDILCYITPAIVYWICKKI